MTKQAAAPQMDAVLAQASASVEWESVPTGTPQLLRAVRIGLIAKGSSFNAWCTDNGTDRGWATRALCGLSDGRAARKLRRRLVTAAGLSA